MRISGSTISDFSKICEAVNGYTEKVVYGHV
jgi:hypothetical protein